MLQRITLLSLLLPLLWAAQQSQAATYTVRYEVAIEPEQGRALVAIKLAGEELPSKLILHLNPRRHLELNSSQELELKGDKAIWRPEGANAELNYQFVIDEQRSGGRYDSRITKEWAIMRSDELIPPIAATASRKLKSRATLAIELPGEWSVAAPYEETSPNVYALKDPGRRFVRPKGWLIMGAFASRQDIIAGTRTRVAAPRGQNIRLQDTLAFLNWTLPEIKKVFPDFPARLLIVSAGDPMWRGGLSGTRSLFMHGDRPLISGNRTSSLIHELIHVATGIRGDATSDWIVEGLAEFYAASMLQRSGGMSEDRFEQTMVRLEKWGRQAPKLRGKNSSGARTARAAALMYKLDLEIRRVSEGQASLDDVARGLAANRGRVSLSDFRKLAAESAGGELQVFQEISHDPEADLYGDQAAVD